MSSPLVSPAGAADNADRMDLMALVHRRAQDERPNVRRAALQVAEGVGVLLGTTCLLTPADIAVFVDASTDAAMSIRKQAITSLTALLHKHARDPALQTAWLQAVPASVLDTESTVEKKAIESVVDVVLKPVAGKITKRCAFAVILSWQDH